jgi:hypothetical protein
MLPALGAASSLLDALQSLTKPKSSTPQATGFSQSPSDPFDLSGSAASSAGAAQASATGACSQLSPATMSALLAAQSQSSTATTAQAPTSRADALKDLFSKLDADGDGQISKSEFESALGAGGTNIAQAGKLDQDGSRAGSLAELSSAPTGGHHPHVAGSGEPGGSSGAGTGASSNADPLLQALQTATTTLTNADGSTTTSLSYGDGSKVTITLPSAASVVSAATSSYNLIEQMIQREAQAISFSATTPSFSLST